MKNSFLFLLTSMIIFASNIDLVGQKDDKSTFENFLKTVYAAYESADNDAMWSYYTKDAAEISPDGSIQIGKKSMKAGWDEMMKIVDGQPKFTYNLTSWRLINADVALVTWDSTADIKIGGQQVGGPSTCMAVLHKVKGDWKIEFDSMTPQVQMMPQN